jgi:hypothetical protein
MAAIVPRLVTDLGASEFSPDGFCRLGPDARKDPLDPACHRPELIQGDDVFLLQRLPGAPRQAQSINRTWNGFIQRHRAGLPAWQFKDQAVRERPQFIFSGEARLLPPTPSRPSQGESMNPRREGVPRLSTLRRTDTQRARCIHSVRPR